MPVSENFCLTDCSLKGRLALVTGASRGIGRALALALAKRGAHIIAIARTISGLEDLDDAIRQLGGRATLVPLDLKDMQAIDTLGATLYERWGKLDILVANAGILGALSPVSHMEPQLFEEVMLVNVTSQWRLIRSLEPLLRHSDAGRVILLSSGAAHRVRPFWGIYGASKAAVEIIARSWAEEVKQTGLKINCVNPGATRTAMRAQAMPGEDPATLPTAEEVAEKIVPLASPLLEETGKLFDVRLNRFLDYSMPA